MCLDKKDLRLKLDPDMHAAYAVLAEVDGKDLGELGAEIIEQWVRMRVHAASVISERTARLGISGNLGESRGTGGNGIPRKA